MKKFITMLMCTFMMVTVVCPTASFAADSMSYEYVIPMVHKEIQQMDETKRYIVRDDDHAALYDYDGNKLSADYTNLGFLSSDSDWLAWDGSKQLILNNDGKSLGFEVGPDKFVSSVGNGVIVLLDIPFAESDDWWLTYTGDVHVYDYSGKLLSSFSYPEHKNVEEAHKSHDISFSDGLFTYRASDGLCGAIDKNGNIVIKPQFQNLYGFTKGYSLAKQNGKYGIVDKTGAVIVDFIYDDIKSWNETIGGKFVYIITKDGKWGIMSDDFKVTAEPQFTDMEVNCGYSESNLIGIKKDVQGSTKYGLMSMDGKLLTDCVYDETTDPAEGRIAVKNASGSWGYIDYNGKSVTDFTYAQAAQYSEGLAFVLTNADVPGFIDMSGKMVINLQNINTFNYFNLLFSEGIASISDLGGNSIFIDKNGSTLIKAENGEQWTSVSTMIDNKSIVSTGSVRYPGPSGVIKYTPNSNNTTTPPASDSSADTPSAWAQPEVTAAIAAQIVPESLQKNYTKPISRKDFCQLAAAMLQKKDASLTAWNADYVTPFTDTDDKNIVILNHLGIIDGRGNDIFDPNASISRQEAAKIMVQTAGVLKLTTTTEYYEYADSSTADKWALPYISESYSLNVMQGVGENKFDPKGTYTTEQSILTMLRLYNKAVVQLTLS